MKTKVIFVLLFALLGNALSADINGQLTELEDRYILHVWGNHYERGYAMGFLMAENIMDVFCNYFFPTAAANNVSVYNYGLQYYLDHFVTDSRYLDEASGMIAGLQDSEVDIYHQSLQRELGLDDILFINAIVDLSTGQIRDLELGCSSLSSWGDATLLDPELNGNLQITRLLDWNRNTALIRNSTMVVHHPSEPDEQKWISFTYPGLIGALSAITESKSAAFLNVGNVHTNTSTSELSTVLLNIRSGLERIDFNDDGSHDPEDLFSSLSSANHLSGTIIHNVQEWPDSAQAVIIETNNTGTVRRMVGQNSGVAGSNLAATNHFRQLSDAVYCYRYTRIVDSLAVSPEVDIDRQWQIMQGAGGTQSNLMMIQYLPSQSRIHWANASPWHAAYLLEPMIFDTQELFTLPTSTADLHQIPQVQNLSLYPNPIRRNQSLYIKESIAIKQVDVYNLKGQIIHSSDQLPDSSVFSSNGVYLLRITDQDNGKHLSRMLFLQ